MRHRRDDPAVRSTRGLTSKGKRGQDSLTREGEAMRATLVAALAAMLAGCSCGSTPKPPPAKLCSSDGGTDSCAVDAGPGVDGGADAGPTDAGPTDGGNL